MCLFVRDMVGWVILPLSYFFKLVCYAHVFPCIYIYMVYTCSTEQDHAALLCARAGTCAVYCIIYSTFILLRQPGPLAQSVERRADNAKVVSSRLTWTNFFYFAFFFSSFFVLFFLPFLCVF